jgi:hypothetical protein
MFESMMELSEQTGLKMDGAVDRGELMTRPWNGDLDSETRAALEDFVFTETPCRHKFNDAMGQRGIVYFDERGRAAHCLIGEMASSELMRQARIHGWRDKGQDHGAEGDTAHGTLVMRDNTSGNAGYVHPYTEEKVPDSEVPEPDEENPDFMPMARRMVKVIRKQTAPRSRVLATRKDDGNIVISVDEFTPIVVASDGYVYETRFGHINPMRRIGHIQDLLETGFDFKLNALDRSGNPESIRSRPQINEDAIGDIEDTDLRDAATKLKESFGGHQFSVNRAWVVGVDRQTLNQLITTGTIQRIDDQYQITPLRQEEVEPDIDDILAEGWGSVETGWKTKTMEVRKDPVGTADYKAVNYAGTALWGAYDAFAGSMGNVVSSWSALCDDPKIGEAADNLMKAIEVFDRHTRTWRAGVNLFRERNGKIDIARFTKDTKASLAKSKKLMDRFESVAAMVKKTDPEEWSDTEHEFVITREGYRGFVKSADALVKTLLSVK